MNANYITRALCFHGQPLQKIWEDERGAGDLQKWGVSPQSNYSVYQERQKYFTFQDRAKRLKLHQFFARKATDLFSNELGAYPGVLEDEKPDKATPYIAIMPPYEVFVNKSQDKVKRGRCMLEGIKAGDIVYGVLTKASLTSAPTAKPLCTAEPLVRYLSDVSLKAYIPYSSIGSLPLDRHGKPRSYTVNDFVCCEVLEVSIDADRLTLGMEGVLTKNKHIKLGLVSSDDLPAYYRKSNDSTSERFEDCLLKTKEFLNPNYDVLFEINGLKVNETFTLMNSLKFPFPRSEYAKELRQTQASKWAFRSVAEGIERFKNGHHVEAFQCLNKALNIDPQNVEGLVARGALYANKGSFLKAVEDFEKALKLNSFHANARKYMGETLVALGRSYEEENRIKEAAKAYRDCLKITPNHEQARVSLEAINQRSGNQYFDIFNIAGATEEEEEEAPKKKRDNGVSASSSSSDSAESSSGSESDSESNTNNNRAASLSPLSKRLALHAAYASSTADPNSQSFNQPFYMTSYNIPTEPPPLITSTSTTTKDINDFKLDDDDTESRVRKLLQEASKHKKEKTKKSKKNKSKKSKKDNRKDKDANQFLENINFHEAYRAISSLNIENKLNENLQIYEKTIAEIKRRQEILQQSISTSVANLERQREETPPPKPPSMKIFDKNMPSTSRLSTSEYSSGTVSSAAASLSKNEQPKLSFQIRRAVKVDKFGLVRIATPLATKSRSVSRSKSRSLSPGRRHSRRSDRERNSRSRRVSNSRDDYRRRRTRSRSNSRSRHGRRSNLNGRNRRRTPSPFLPRDRDRTSRRFQRSKRSRSRSDSPTTTNSQKFGNRVWQRPGYAPPVAKKPTGKNKFLEGRWLHDRYKDNDDNDSTNKKKANDDGPSIEEIDEIINKAQKERKQEIIKRDKDLLKKPNTGHF